MLTTDPNLPTPTPAPATESKPIQYRKHLAWGEHDPHRRQSTPLGMWAWLWQRISALLIVVLLVLHIALPYKPAIQFLLLLTVTFHATLGLRVILLDFNLVSVRHHRTLAWALPLAGLAVLFVVWRWIY
jgi:succinate dehydrogenase hydrophobic anchor subunit